MSDEKNKKPQNEAETATDVVDEKADAVTPEKADTESEGGKVETVPSVAADKDQPDPVEDEKNDEDVVTAPSPAIVAPVAPRRADWLARIAALAALGIAGVSAYAMYSQGAFDPLIKGAPGPMARIAALESGSAGGGQQNYAERLAEAAEARQQIAAQLASLQTELAALKEAGPAAVATPVEQAPSSDTPTAAEPATNSAAPGLDPATIATLQAEIETLRGVADQVAEMQVRLAELTETATAATDPAGDEDAGLKAVDPQILAQLATLQGGYLALQKDVNERLDVMQQGIERRVTDLRLNYENRLQSVEKLAAETAATPRGADPATIDRAALVLALGRMQQAAESGRSFAASWQAAAELDRDGIVAGLKDYAATGVPSVSQLTADFAAAADDAVTAERLHGASGWLAKTTQRAAAAITVRRTGELGGDDAEAIVARAEMRLAEGDLTAALAELDRLGEEPARAMKAWRSVAERRHALDQAVDQARQNLFDNLAKGD